jgi:hypothetical protein
LGLRSGLSYSRSGPRTSPSIGFAIGYRKKRQVDNRPPSGDQGSRYVALALRPRDNPHTTSCMPEASTKYQITKEIYKWTINVKMN